MTPLYVWQVLDAPTELRASHELSVRLSVRLRGLMQPSALTSVLRRQPRAHEILECLWIAP